MAFGVTGDVDDPMAEINVVPFIDVMLVLLVIFMVTAPMLQQGVDVNLPKATTAPLEGRAEQIVLSIDKEGKIFVGAGNEVLSEEIGTKVAAIFEARKDPEKKVYIKADAANSYGRVMEVMGRLHEAGITQIGLVSGMPDKATPKKSVKDQALASAIKLKG